MIYLKEYKLFEKKNWSFLDELNNLSKEEIINFINFFIRFNYDYTDYNIEDDLHIDHTIFVDNDKSTKLIYIFVNQIIYKDESSDIVNGKLEQLNIEDLLLILKTLFRDKYDDVDIGFNSPLNKGEFSKYRKITEEEYPDFYNFTNYINKCNGITDGPIFKYPKTWREYLKQKNIKKFKI